MASSGTGGSQQGGGRTGPFALLLAAFCLAGLLLSFSPRAGNFDQDEFAFYMPSVVQISQHWPALDLIKDATSATSPGYPYFLAGLGQVIGVHLHAFRIVTLGLSALTLALLLGSFRPAEARLAVWAVLPLAACNFFVKSSAWVVTDNPGLLLVCLTMLSLRHSLEAERGSRVAGGWAAGAIFVRQLHAWLLAPLGITAAVLSLAPAGSAAAAGPRRLVAAWTQLVPPLAILLWLVLTWHGLVPPVWHELHASAIAPVSLACALALAFALGSFYLLTTETPRAALGLMTRPLALGAAAVGLGVALAGPSIENKADGHWGGYFWWVIGRTPALGSHALLIVVAAPVGAALLAALALRLGAAGGWRPALLWASSVAAWLATCAFNRVAFERYFDPMLLVFLIGWLALVTRGPRPAAVRARWPLVTLGLAQLAVTLVTTYLPLFR